MVLFEGGAVGTPQVAADVRFSSAHRRAVETPPHLHAKQRCYDDIDEANENEAGWGFAAGLVHPGGDGN